jgi:hypothetical protein
MLIMQVSSSALAQAGMWAVAIHTCTAAGKCTEGVMTKNSPLYVSKQECEREAQKLLNYMQSLGIVIKYVKCVQL